VENNEDNSWDLYNLGRGEFIYSLIRKHYKNNPSNTVTVDDTEWLHVLEHESENENDES